MKRSEMYNKPMGITYQIGYCGNAFRVDTYKGCDFGCDYCFTKNNSYDNKRCFKLANMNFIKNNFRKAFDTDNEYDDIIVEMLRHRVPLHLGGMSDPFQERENEHKITYKFLELTKKYNYPIIMSTKTAHLDDEYFDLLDNNIHAFQISLIGTDESWIRNFEENTPSPQERIEFIKKLKLKGFWVSVRIQPLISLEQAKNVVRQLSHIVDYITVEHLKVYNRKGVKEKMFEFSDSDWTDYKYTGKKYELNAEIKKRNIEELKKISKCPIGCGDNDLHEFSDSNNCCGVDTINDNFNGWIKYNSMYINKTGDKTQWCPKSFCGSNLNTEWGNNRLKYKDYVDKYMGNNENPLELSNEQNNIVEESVIIMDKKTKVLTFENEIKWIKNKDIRKFAIEMISILPDYFFTVAASSTGKYHPDYSLGEGGLVRHTKAAMLIAKTLLDLEQYKNKYDEEQRDIMLTAILLHDGVKHGVEGGKYSVASHPTDMVGYISDFLIKKNLDPWDDMITTVNTICDCIATHMGEWVTDWKTKEVILDKPETDMQKFVHMCDFLASRKFLEVNFEKVEY